MSVLDEIDLVELEQMRMGLTPAECVELDAIYKDYEVKRKKETKGVDWIPLPGPQLLATRSRADIIGFGGAAGGGKTDLGIGWALTEHHVSAIFRREGTELTAIEDRIRSILGNDDGYNSTKRIWRPPNLPDKQIEFGSVPNAGDELKYQGRPKDLLHLDETTSFLRPQVEFLMGWVRTTLVGQRTRVLMTFNPPVKSEGRWIIEYYAPWLDPHHPNPAQPGEIRFFAQVAERTMEMSDGRKFILVNDEPVFDFDPAEHDVSRIISPKSRTFIPSRIGDNPYLVGTNYMSTLQAMPEPLRSQMLYGDFTAGMQDDAFQVIPTAWVDAAMARWTKGATLPPMDSMGVDVARGGADNTVIARRHGWWFDAPVVYKGIETPDGPKTAGVVITALRNRAPIHIDVIGIGASPYDFLRQAGVQILGVNVAMPSLSKDRTGMLAFYNTRSELWWRMRELLDPANNFGAALPPDSRLKADLCAPLFYPEGKIIRVEGREEIIKRIGRSPDWASAYLLALYETPRWEDLPGQTGRATNSRVIDYDPVANF